MIHQRALLLTDVVDSTRLSLRIGDAEMALLWAAHDRVARDLLPPWHGREIDKTDGMLLLFSAASHALGYALAYQQALSQLVPPLEARAGLHVGAVTLRENSPSDVALGAKPIEVDTKRPIAASSLARHGWLKYRIHRAWVCCDAAAAAIAAQAGADPVSEFGIALESVHALINPGLARGSGATEGTPCSNR